MIEIKTEPIHKQYVRRTKHVPKPLQQSKRTPTVASAGSPGLLYLSVTMMFCGLHLMAIGFTCGLGLIFTLPLHAICNLALRSK